MQPFNVIYCLPVGCILSNQGSNSLPQQEIDITWHLQVFAHFLPFYSSLLEMCSSSNASLTAFSMIKNALNVGYAWNQVLSWSYLLYCYLQSEVENAIQLIFDSVSKSIGLFLEDCVAKMHLESFIGLSSFSLNESVPTIAQVIVFRMGMKPKRRAPITSLFVTVSLFSHVIVNCSHTQGKMYNFWYLCLYRCHSIILRWCLQELQARIKSVVSAYVVHLPKHHLLQSQLTVS